MEISAIVICAFFAGVCVGEILGFIDGIFAKIEKPEADE